MAESLRWERLNRKNIQGQKGKLILTQTPNGQGFYGEVARIETGYVQLRNGNQLQNVYYNNNTARFAVILPPTLEVPRMGEPFFKFDGDS